MNALAGLPRRSARHLLRTFLLLEFRNQSFGRSTGTGTGAMFTPLFWVVGQHLFISLLVAVVLFARVDAWAFACFAQLIGMVAVAIEETVLVHRDERVLGHLPLPAGAVLALRLLVLLALCLVLSLAIHLFPALAGIGLRDGGWWWLPAYGLDALLGALLITGLLLLALRWSRSDRGTSGLREILAWTQAGLLIVTGYGGQAILRDDQDRFELAAATLPDWVAWTPPGRRLPRRPWVLGCLLVGVLLAATDCLLKIWLLPVVQIELSADPGVAATCAAALAP